MNFISAQRSKKHVFAAIFWHSVNAETEFSVQYSFIYIFSCVENNRSSNFLIHHKLIVWSTVLNYFYKCLTFVAYNARFKYTDYSLKWEDYMIFVFVFCSSKSNYDNRWLFAIIFIFSFVFKYGFSCYCSWLETNPDYFDARWLVLFMRWMGMVRSCSVGPFILIEAVLFILKTLNPANHPVIVTLENYWKIVVKE